MFGYRCHHLLVVVGFGFALVSPSQIWLAASDARLPRSISGSTASGHLAVICRKVSRRTGAARSSGGARAKNVNALPSGWTAEIFERVTGALAAALVSTYRREEHDSRLAKPTRSVDSQEEGTWV